MRIAVSSSGLTRPPTSVKLDPIWMMCIRSDPGLGRLGDDVGPAPPRARKILLTAAGGQSSEQRGEKDESERYLHRQVSPSEAAIMG